MIESMIGSIVIAGMPLFCVLNLGIPIVFDYIRVNMRKTSMSDPRSILMTVLHTLKQLDSVIKIVIKILLRLSSGLMLRIILDSILGDSIIPQNILSFILDTFSVPYFSRGSDGSIALK